MINFAIKPQFITYMNSALASMHAFNSAYSIIKILPNNTTSGICQRQTLPRLVLCVEDVYHSTLTYYHATWLKLESKNIY